MTAAPGRAGGWTRTHAAVLVIGLALGVAVRLALLPTDGLRGDLDQFVLWVHGIAVNGIAQAYDQNLSFPPVMALIWGVLATIEPAFRTVTDGADPAIRVLMKLPATLADLGIALGVAWALRRRPPWALAASLAVWLHPAVVDVSAWWGQYESIYALGGLAAYLLAVSGRPGLACVALGVALMTKPQALPFLVPFAAWFLARFPLVQVVRYGVIGAVTIVVLWLPFAAAGGPARYLANLGEYQNDIFAVLSLRAWNPWWILQDALGRGDFVGDGNPIAGPVTFRMLGFAVTGLLAIVVFFGVGRSPSRRGLALGLAAITLVAFTTLTTMHERYAYAALVFLAPLLPDRRVLAVWLVLGATMTLNLLAAAPPNPTIAGLIPVGGVLGIAGSVVMAAVTAAVVGLLLRESGRGDLAPAEPTPKGSRVPVEVMR